jgi:MATE family multidrug resistance protein
MLRLSIPVVVGYLGIMAMALVDLLFVGRVGPAAIGAMALCNSVFAWFLIFGIGLMTGLDYLVSHAFGAGRREDCHHYLTQGLVLSVALGLPLSGVLYLLAGHLDALGVNPEVAPGAADCLRIQAFSLIGVYVFAACRQYLQAMGVVRPAMLILLAANGVNALANWVLVFGNWGAPALGVQGSSGATLVSRIFMAGSIIAYAAWHGRRSGGWLASGPLALDWRKVGEILKLGFPSSLQMTFEVGVFAVSTALAARLATAELAAHQIVLNTASLTFMVPLGVGSATAVMVGQAQGRRDPAGAAASGWRGLALGTGFMLAACLAMLAWPGPILRFYTEDEAVLSVARGLLVIAALFQLSDGAQVVATGALRGKGDTRTPAIVNLCGHWLVGLPLGAWACFRGGWGLKGLWVGLSVGLTVVAGTLVLAWRQRSRADARPA